MKIHESLIPLQQALNSQFSVFSLLCQQLVLDVLYEVKVISNQTSVQTKYHTLIKARIYRLINSFKAYEIHDLHKVLKPLQVIFFFIWQDQQFFI